MLLNNFRMIIVVLTVLVGVSVLSMSGCRQAKAPGDPMLDRSAMPMPVLNHTTKSAKHAVKASQEWKARKIARQRYDFLKRLAPKFDGLPLWQQPGDSTAAKIVLFPVGRSDRLYLFFRGDADQETQMFCYQRKNGKDRLVYKIQMVVQNRPAAKMTRLRNLLDFVYSEGSNNNFDGKEYDYSYTLPAGTSQFAKNDLALPGDYAEYGYLPLGGALFVALFSQYRNGDFIQNTDDEYNLYEDPMTKATLKEGEFYRKYGLPVAKGELSGER